MHDTHPSRLIASRTVPVTAAMSWSACVTAGPGPKLYDTTSTPSGMDRLTFPTVRFTVIGPVGTGYTAS